MKQSKLPAADSIRALAEFWDAHDLTAFEDQLEEVSRPVFVRDGALAVPLESAEIKAVEKLAKAQGVSAGELVRGWVLRNLPRPKRSRRTKRAG